MKNLEIVRSIILNSSFCVLRSKFIQNPRMRPAALLALLIAILLAPRALA